MRVLIDECLPRQLKGWLAQSHSAETVQEIGWANVKNGELLRLANDAGFDVLVTADKNIHFQQNFTGLRLCALVIPSNRKIRVQKSVFALLQSLCKLTPGQKVPMDLGPDVDSWPSLKLETITQTSEYTIHVFKLPDKGRP